MPVIVSKEPAFNSAVVIEKDLNKVRLSFLLYSDNFLFGIIEWGIQISKDESGTLHSDNFCYILCQKSLLIIDQNEWSSDQKKDK